MGSKIVSAQLFKTIYEKAEFLEWKQNKKNPGYALKQKCHCLALQY